jgi:hypothetical protein
MKPAGGYDAAAGIATRMARSLGKACMRNTDINARNFCSDATNCGKSPADVVGRFPLADA